MKKNKSLFICGLWHLGLINAVCLADLGFQVLAYDTDENKIKQLQKGEPTIFEPGLTELLRKNLKNGRLVFTHNLTEIKKTSTVLIAQDTPLNDQDLVDLKPLKKFVQEISEFIQDKSVVIITSQVPVGTTEEMGKILQAKNKTIEMAYVPENLQLGRALERFFKPKMIVIGAENRTVFNRVKAVYQKIRSPKIFTDIKSAEMVKHAINSYLAMSISYANELGNLSEKCGADFWEVASIIKQDERIGQFARILPGLGFAGGTLARDLKILQKFGKKYKSPTILVDAILAVNETQKKWVTTRLKNIFGNDLSRKKIALLGLTYTANTSTLRRSLAIETANQLLRLNAKVFAYDPQADPIELRKYTQIKTVKTVSQLMQDADAVVLMTGWDDFKKLPWPKIKRMVKNPLILDPNNFLKNIELSKLGFSYLVAGTSYEKN